MYDIYISQITVDFEMNHKYSEVVEFQYNRELLLEVVEQIVKEEGLFKKSVPISAFSKLRKIQILNALKISYGSTLFNIYVNHVTIACLRPNQRSAVHVDRDKDNTPTTKAFNIPVTPCNGVIMNWYDTKPGSILRSAKSARGWDIPSISIDQGILQHSQKADKPFIVNPSTFHDIVNNNETFELIISIRTGNEHI